MTRRLALLVLTACSASPKRASPTHDVHDPHAPTVASDPRDPTLVANNTVTAKPAGDLDHDEILDDVDRCATVPEDWDAFQDDDGCPDPDDDNDGFLDADDDCPDEKAPDHHGCPPSNCKITIIDGISDCFLSDIYNFTKPNLDADLRKLVAEVSTFPEIYEVTIKMSRLPSEPKDSVLPKLEQIRARLVALGWPTRIPIQIYARGTTSDPERIGIVLADVSKQRFEHDKFRPGVCTMAGDVYRPERPDTKCRIRRP